MAGDRDIERLVDQVTDLVMARLRGPVEPGRPALRRPVDVLLPIQTSAIDGLLPQLGRLAAGGHRIAVRTTARVLAWLERTGRSARLPSPIHALDEACLCESLGDYDPRQVVVFGSLGFGLIDRLGALDDDDSFVRLASQALLRGARVLAVDADLRPVRSGDPLGARADQALRALAGLGVEVLGLEGLADRIEALGAADTTLTRALAGLLTEADVEHLHADGRSQVVLDARAVVTPLARSRAAALGVELVQPER